MFRTPNISYLTEDFDTRTRGIDAVLTYAHAVGAGRVNLSLAYNYNQTRVRSGTSAAITNATQR
ncbi:hypothetical protein ACMGDM_11485, partial [Sphingomonas sp. DT-51]|uniref:hypothetical protein n=1 Tax=Sphingomonas sp. DT-51 TaxID=3396165 RepID=UPI003F1C1AC3